MRAMLCSTLTLALCFGASAEDKKDEKIDAKKLVGKWEPKEKAKSFSVVVEFTKDGKVTTIIVSDGKERREEGTYKTDGNKLSITRKSDDKEESLALTVSKLTDTELVTTDEKGKERSFVRIKDK